MKWQPDGPTSQTCGDWRITKFSMARGWAYRLYRKRELRGEFESAQDAKEAAEKWKP